MVLCNTFVIVDNFIIGDDSSADAYKTSWRNRTVLFDRIFWNENNSLWQDWDIVTKDHRSGYDYLHVQYIWTNEWLVTDSIHYRYYGSTLLPLVWGCGSDNITRQIMVMQRLKSLGLLDYPGGIPTSLNSSSSQQWDYPNVCFEWKNEHESTIEM